MKNSELVKGINAVIEGLELIKKSLLADDTEVIDETVKDVEVTEEKSTDVPEDVEELKYNDLKKLAISLGLEGKGTRQELIDRIREYGNSDVEEVEEDDEEEVEEEEKPAKKGRKNSVNRPSKKKEVEEKEDDEEVNEEVDEKELKEQQEEILECWEVDDLIMSLKDAGVKATKKNYKEKLLTALREGVINYSDYVEIEEDENELDFVPDEEPKGKKSSIKVVDKEGKDIEVEDDEDDEEEEELEIDLDSYFEQYDIDGVNNPDDMTEERSNAIEDMMEDILDSYTEGELTDEDVKEYIDERATEEEKDLLGKKPSQGEMFKLYCEMMKKTIDDSGEKQEDSSPYEIQEENFCCGHKLKYVKKTKKYVCELCGEEYETE